MTKASNSSARRWLFWLVVAALFFVFIYAIKAILLPFVVGILVAYFLDPAADRLERAGLSRTSSTAVITLSFFIGITLVIIVLSPMVYRQLGGVIEMIPKMVADLRELIEPYIERVMGQMNGDSIQSAKAAVSDVSSKLVGNVGLMGANLLQSGMALINLASLLVITPVVSFYLLRDWDRVVAKVDDLLPREYADTIREQVSIIDDTMSGFIRGTVNVMIILGTFYAIALSVVGLKFAIIVGLLAGMLIIIPYIGTVLSGIAAVGLAYFQFDTMTPVMVVAGVFIAGQVLEGYVLTPKLVGEKVGLHPLWLIFGMLAGAALFGFVGVFLAVPVTAIVGVLVRFAIVQYKQSSYYGAPSPSRKS